MIDFPLAQIAVGLPSSWVQVGPWQTESQVIVRWVFSAFLAVTTLSVTGVKMVASPLTTGLPAEQINSSLSKENFSSDI